MKKVFLENLTPGKGNFMVHSKGPTCTATVQCWDKEVCDRGARRQSQLKE